MSAAAGRTLEVAGSSGYSIFLKISFLEGIGMAGNEVTFYSEPLLLDVIKQAPEGANSL
jgi:hypothetical protein